MKATVLSFAANPKKKGFQEVQSMFENIEVPQGVQSYVDSKCK